MLRSDGGLNRTSVGLHSESGNLYVINTASCKKYFDFKLIFIAGHAVYRLVLQALSFTAQVESVLDQPPPLTTTWTRPSNLQTLPLQVVQALERSSNVVLVDRHQLDLLIRLTGKD